MESFRGRTNAFDRDELEFLCLELITGEIPSRGTEGWLDGCSPDDLIEVLWNVGFLRVEASRDAEPRRPASGLFVGAHQARYLNPAAAQRFQVHPMFHGYLGTGSRSG